MENRTSVFRIRAIVFDLGGVLMDWDPRHLYRKLFGGDEAAMEKFLATVCTAEWIRRQDEGLPVADAVAQLSASHPDQSHLIAAYDMRWVEMVAGSIEESVSVLRDIRQRGLPMYGLTNLPAEKYPLLRARLQYLDWFEAVVVSGAVGVAKPHPDIYRHLLASHKLSPASTVYIDDVAENVAGAKALGLHALQFISSTKLRSDLSRLGVL